MKILTDGHKYELANFEEPEKEGQVIQFIEKGTKGRSKKLVTINDGTTNEEVIDMLVDRITFLNEKMPHIANRSAVAYLKIAKRRLNERTADRKKRGVEGTLKP